MISKFWGNISILHNLFVFVCMFLFTSQTTLMYAVQYSMCAWESSLTWSRAATLCQSQAACSRPGGSTQRETLLFNFSTSSPSVMKLPSRTFAHTLPVLLAGNWDVTEHEYPLRLPQTDLPATLQIALCLNGHIIFYLDLHLKVIVSRRGLLQ